MVLESPGILKSQKRGTDTLFVSQITPSPPIQAGLH